MPPDDTDGLDDADLPGLDDIPSTEDVDLGDAKPDPSSHDEVLRSAMEHPVDWSSAGKAALLPLTPGGLTDSEIRVKRDADRGDRAATAGEPETPSGQLVDDVWIEGEDPHSVIGDLAPYGSDHSQPPKPFVPRWIFLGGGFGVLGLVLMVGVFLNDGSDEADSVTTVVPTSVVETVPPTTVPPSTVPPTTVPPAPAFATVTGTLDPVLVPDPLFVHSVASSFVAMEFPITGGPFVGTAVLELLHDVPKYGCQFQSVHEWEFSGMFDPATLEFLGTATELEDETTGNCEPGQASLIYQMEPAEGTFYARLYLQDGEIRATGFKNLTAPVSQTLIDALSGS